MKPTSVDILNIRYRRPGITMIDFLADYGDFLRRGTVTYDTINQIFLSHNRSVDLLASLCLSLQKPHYKRV